jgi:cobalt-zinc-cadmium efflux system protein
MGHPHDHGGTGHHHGVSPDADRRWLAIALGLVAAFMAVEVVAGILASSLALLSDAAHMLTDAGAIGLALVAARLAARPPGGRFTFGLGRAEILSAQGNGAALLVLAGILAVEAVTRLSHPANVDGAFVVIVGTVGAGVNVATAWALSRAERRSLAVQGAIAHVLTDLYASLAAILAGAAILLWGWDRADPIASLAVSALMVRSGWMLLRDSARVLLEAAPAGVDPRAVGHALAAEPGVVEVHDLHVWEVTSGFPALAAHVLVRPGDDCHATRRRLQRVAEARFGIRHVTLQVDHAPDEHPLLDIEGRAPVARPDR